MRNSLAVSNEKSSSGKAKEGSSMELQNRSTQSLDLLDTCKSKDLNNSSKKRRIEIYFRGRYVSIDKNVSMKEKIN